MSRPTSRQKYVTGESKGVNRRVGGLSFREGQKTKAATPEFNLKVVDDPRMAQLTDSFHAVASRNKKRGGGR